MDSANIRNMMRITGGDPDGKMHKLLEFAGEQGDIADPWYTGNFDQTYADVERGCAGFLEYLVQGSESVR
jgi:protein-tyrosine phosphatase